MVKFVDLESSREKKRQNGFKRLMDQWTALTRPFLPQREDKLS